MAAKRKIYGYLGLRKDEKGSITAYWFNRDIEKVKDLGLLLEKAGHSENQMTKAINEEGASNSMVKIMNRIVDSIRSQSELVILSAAMKNLFPRMILENEIAKPVESLSCVVHVQGDAVIYGLPEEEFRKLPAKHERLNRLERGLGALPAALLMSIVSTFDANIADFVRDMLMLRSDFLQTGTKTVLLRDVLQAGSIAEVKEQYISDEIYQFSRGGHDEQVQYIEKNFHIEIRKHWKRWPDFMEVFERRNLVAHGEKTFTKRYVSICKHHGHKGSEKVLGEPIELTIKYLQQALDILLEFSILLVFSLCRKQNGEREEDIFGVINAVVFDLIKGKKYIVPIRVLEYILHLKNTAASESVRRMMIVNLASAYRHRQDKVNVMRCCAA